MINVTPMHKETIEGLEFQKDDSVLSEICDLKNTFGRDLIILAHYYQRKLITDLATFVGDSYSLAEKAHRAEGRYIVFCGVRFMAESAAILARQDQSVYHPDPEAGCPMADMAPIEDVVKIWEKINERGDFIPITYMNSSADIKAFCGQHGGLVCTSRNAPNAFRWVQRQSKKIFFLPDEHLGKNTAHILKIPDKKIFLLNPHEFLQESKPDIYDEHSDLLDAELIVWKGYCPVHQKFTVRDIEHIRAFYPRAIILVHPECPKEVALRADQVGSTDFISRYVAESTKPGDEIFIGTEIHLIQSLSRKYPDRLISKINRSLCLTMYQITLKKLLSTLKNIPHTMPQVILDPYVKENARIALQRMLNL